MTIVEYRPTRVYQKSPIYRCSKCGEHEMVHLRDGVLKETVDEANELGLHPQHFIYIDWSRPREYSSALNIEYDPTRCSHCLTGNWHGFFPRGLRRH